MSLLGAFVLCNSTESNMIMNGWAAAFVALALGATSTTAQLDAEALRDVFAEFAADSARDDGALWGRELAGPVLLVDPEYRDAFGNHADAEGRLVAIEGLFAGRVGARFPMANSSTTWAGTEWATVMLPLPADDFSRRALLLHESFHRIQDELGLAVTSADNGHLDEGAARASLRAELRAWARALERTDDNWQDAARDALALRARRYGRDGVEDAEAALERHEGLAEYTGVKLASSNAEEAERHTVRALAEFEGRPSYVRSFAYATGPALGLVLDRLDDDWRAKAMRGAQLHVLIQAALEPRDHTVREELYEVEELMREETAREDQRRARIENDLRRFVTGPRVLLPLAEILTTYDPNRVRPLKGHGTIYEVLGLDEVWGRLDVTSGGALMGSMLTQAVVEGVSEDAVDAAVTELNTTRSLEGPGWSLRLVDGWQATRRGADIEIARQ